MVVVVVVVIGEKQLKYWFLQGVCDLGLAQSDFGMCFFYYNLGLKHHTY
jgi:hypothetical protein